MRTEKCQLSNAIRAQRNFLYDLRVDSDHLAENSDVKKMRKKIQINLSNIRRRRTSRYM